MSKIIGVINYNSWGESKPKLLYVFSQTLNFFYASEKKDGIIQKGYAKRDYEMIVYKP